MERRPDPALERLVCSGCNRSFPSVDAEAMLAALKGHCPDCGGRFESAEPARERPEGEAAGTSTAD